MPSPQQKHTFPRQWDHLSALSPPLLSRYPHSTALIFPSAGFNAEVQDGLFAGGHEAAGVPVHVTGTLNKTLPCFSAYPMGHRITCPPTSPGAPMPDVPMLGGSKPTPRRRGIAAVPRGQHRSARLSPWKC